jgi:hypothetical protein
MFEKLKKKWKVTNLDLFLILCVFAVTGTTTAYISRYITDWLGLSAESPLWKRAALRGGMLIFGQFKFFWNYEKKILRRMGILKKEEKTED